MTTLRSAVEHYRRQQRITALGLAAARRARRGGTLRVVTAVAAFQNAAAQDAVAAVPLMLEEQGLEAPPEGGVNVAAFAGVASDGRALDTLVEQARTQFQFDQIVTTQLQDMARQAAGVALAARPRVSGYVRQLNPPSCSRCAVLAGKFYRWNAGFLRHPLCDCRHIPASEDTAGDLRTDPDAYFKSLDPVQQDKIFTKSGAQAIRDGADLNQVVNARRSAAGLSRAGGRLTLDEQRMLRGGRDVGRLQRTDVYGHQVFITREGITRRGSAGRSLGNFEARDAESVTRMTRRGPEQRTVRRQESKTPRLMPESIYEVAEDRADAIRLLKRHGYIL